jgi:hypothetical protein
MYDTNAIATLYDWFGRHLLTGAFEKTPLKIGSCDITGLSDVPVVNARGKSTRWLCLQSLLTTSAYLGSKNGGSYKRLGDKGAPRLLLASPSGSILWFNENEFEPAVTSKSRPALPPITDHGLFDVRRYRGPGQQNARIMASILISNIATPYVFFPGFSLDMTLDLRNIKINNDANLFRTSGKETSEYRVEPLRQAIDAARGLPVVTQKKNKKNESTPALTTFIELVRSSEVEYDRTARIECKRICRDDPRFAHLHEILAPLAHSAELPLLRTLFNASRNQLSFEVETLNV